MKKADAFFHKNINLYFISQALLGMRFIAPIWILFFSHYLTLEQIGILEVIGLLVTMVLELPSGAFADLVGRKYSVFLGHLLAGIGFIQIGLATSFSTFLIGYIINSIGAAFVSGADTALIFDTLKENKKENLFSKIVGKGVTYFRFTFIFASILGQYLYTLFFGLPYVALGMFTLICAFLYLFMKEPLIDTEKFNLKSYVSQIKNGTYEAFKNLATQRVSFYFLVIASIELILLFFYNAPYLSWIGYSEKNLGWIYALAATFRMGISYFSYEIERFFGERKLVILFPTIIGTLLCFGFIKNIYFGTILFISQYALFILRYTLLDKYTNIQFESKYRAAAISTLNMGVSLLYALVIFGGGKFISLENVGFMFSFLGGVLLLLGLPLGLSLAKHHSFGQQTSQI